jgi:hypothetical protein
MTNNIFNDIHYYLVLNLSPKRILFNINILIITSKIYFIIYRKVSIELFKIEVLFEYLMQQDLGFLLEIYLLLSNLDIIENLLSVEIINFGRY